MDRLIALQIPLIPKPAIQRVPLELNQIPENLDGILIDDDPIIHEIWHEAAERHGKRLAAFTTARDLFSMNKLIPFQTPIYVDVNLGKNVRGDEVAHEIHKLGFFNISLTTAFPAFTFEPSSWLKEVRGKEPPW